MSHTAKTRLFIIAWLLAVVFALYFDYAEYGLGAFAVFAQGYAAKDLYCRIGKYANQYWR